MKEKQELTFDQLMILYQIRRGKRLILAFPGDGGGWLGREYTKGLRSKVQKLIELDYIIQKDVDSEQDESPSYVIDNNIRKNLKNILNWYRSYKGYEKLPNM